MQGFAIAHCEAQAFVLPVVQICELPCWLLKTRSRPPLHPPPATSIRTPAAHPKGKAHSPSPRSVARTASTLPLSLLPPPAAPPPPIPAGEAFVYRRSHRAYPLRLAAVPGEQTRHRRSPPHLLAVQSPRTPARARAIPVSPRDMPGVVDPPFRAPDSTVS